MTIDRMPPIDKGVSMPVPRGRCWPFAHMEIGDSFLAPPDIRRDNLSATVNRYAVRLRRKFATRQTAEGVRVWRTA